MPPLAITIGEGAIGFPAAKQHVWAGTWDSPLLDISRLSLLNACDQGGWLGTPGWNDRIYDHRRALGRSPFDHPNPQFMTMSQDLDDPRTWQSNRSV